MRQLTTTDVPELDPYLDWPVHSPDILLRTHHDPCPWLLLPDRTEHSISRTGGLATTPSQHWTQIRCVPVPSLSTLD
jgi:hypothetical protein